MSHQVVVKYFPDVWQFGQRRGSWRVMDCWRHRGLTQTWPVRTFDAGRDGKLMVIPSAAPRQRNSWCNPRKILAEWQAVVRAPRSLSEFVHAPEAVREKIGLEVVDAAIQAQLRGSGK